MSYHRYVPYKVVLIIYRKFLITIKHPSALDKFRMMLELKRKVCMYTMNSNPHRRPKILFSKKHSSDGG